MRSSPGLVKERYGRLYQLASNVSEVTSVIIALYIDLFRSFKSFDFFLLPARVWEKFITEVRGTWKPHLFWYETKVSSSTIYICPRNF